MADLRADEARQKLIPLLQSHEAFAKSALSTDQIVQFANRADIRFFLQGERVIQQGEQGDEFFVVISGEAKAVDINYDPPRLLSYMGPGEEFGLRALLRSSVRSATV
jgi:CRP-like cAMP-binding protein